MIKMKQKKRTIINIILILSIIGFLTSLYLVNNHYADPAKGVGCDLGEHISCSLVNTSDYSEIFNVPVALCGAIWFLFLFFMARDIKKRPETSNLMLVWCALGLLFIIYMIIVEIILKALCPFCTLVHLIVIVVFILSIKLIDTKNVFWKSNINIPTVLLKSKGWVAAIIILNLIPLILFNVWQGEKENYDDLAKCMTEKGVKMYGSYRCGICTKTSGMFGDSFQYVDEVECHPQGENPQTELCLEKKLETTPTWILEKDGEEIKRTAGFMNMEELKIFSGCENGSS